LSLNLNEEKEGASLMSLADISKIGSETMRNYGVVLRRGSARRWMEEFSQLNTVICSSVNKWHSVSK